MTKIKTIDVHAISWLDRTYGNSYFAGTITVNFGMKTEKRFTMPFQYGSNGMHTQVACKIINKEYKKNYDSLWLGCKDDKIILRTNWSEGHKQKELKNI